MFQGQGPAHAKTQGLQDVSSSAGRSGVRGAGGRGGQEPAGVFYPGGSVLWLAFGTALLAEVKAEVKLALPKVGALPPLSSVPKAVRAISSTEWMGWPEPGVW